MQGKVVAQAVARNWLESGGKEGARCAAARIVSAAGADAHGAAYERVWL